MIDWPQFCATAEEVDVITAQARTVGLSVGATCGPSAPATDRAPWSTIGPLARLSPDRRNQASQASLTCLVKQPRCQRLDRAAGEPKSGRDLISIHTYHCHRQGLPLAFAELQACLDDVSLEVNVGVVRHACSAFSRALDEPAEHQRREGFKQHGGVERKRAVADLGRRFASDYQHRQPWRPQTSVLGN